MTAHILNPSLDPDFPATFSQRTVDGILRKEMRYSKIIFSDDLEMKAITEHYGAEEAAVLALRAGCDCLILRGDFGPPIKQIEAIIKAIEDKRLSKEQLEMSAARISGCKKTYADTKSPIDVTAVTKSIGLPEHFRLADCINKKELPPDLEGEDV